MKAKGEGGGRAPAHKKAEVSASRGGEKAPLGYSQKGWIAGDSLSHMLAEGSVGKYTMLEPSRASRVAQLVKNLPVMW